VLLVRGPLLVAAAVVAAGFVVDEVLVDDVGFLVGFI
jgi:hypothetical protein